MEKKIVFSGVQPSGDLTIGNYLGAIQYFSKLQDDYDCYYCVVDMHSITISQIPAELRKKSLGLMALYIATGIDPDKSVLYMQSHVPEHAELAWILNTITYMGQLSRMTQFKEKVAKNPDNQNVGLFTYPVLMAADILLYQTNFVPVGSDQKQHLELSRDLAERFNNKYSPTFEIPEPLIPDSGGRIMSLKDPNSKMSKSDEDVNASIFIMDNKDTIIRKIKRAVTDSIGEFRYTEEQPGLMNLINIYSAFSGIKPDKIVESYTGENYGRFKEELGILIAEGLEPIQKRYNEIIEDKDYLSNICKQNAERASYAAQKTLRKVKRKIGFYQP